MNYRTLTLNEIMALRDQYTENADTWHALSMLLDRMISEQSNKEKPVTKTAYRKTAKRNMSLDSIIEESKGREPYAFVDGSFNPTTGVYGYGGFLYENGHVYELSGFDSDEEMASMRNIAGEIAGAAAAMELATHLKLKSLHIYYDYLGIEKWYDGNWQAKKKYTQNYAAKARKTAAHMNLTFEHVKGHTGVPGNELADKMAKQAVGI